MIKRGFTSFNPSAAIKSSTSGHWKRWTLDKNNPTFKDKLNFVWDYQIKEMILVWSIISAGLSIPFVIFTGILVNKSVKFNIPFS